MSSEIRSIYCLIFAVLAWCVSSASGQTSKGGHLGYEVVFAINAGGEAHVDQHDTEFDRDPLMDRIGIASDFGKNLLTIGRIDYLPDEYLYQTERYHTATFGYDMPLSGDGDYLLQLMFSEVYFKAPGMKVFDVVLNQQHTVVQALDIFQKVGHGTAHQENVPFRVSRGQLHYNNEESEIRGDRIRVEFLKGFLDNPKVNAIALFKGDVDRVPRLAPQLQDSLDDGPPSVDERSPPSDFNRQQPPNRQAFAEPRNVEAFAEEYQPEHRPATGVPTPSGDSRKSGPRQEDPYALDDSSVMLPVLIAIGAFIPLLFCLCKL